MSTEVVGRLAPTPSGELHLGNALAFAACWLSVRSAGGRLLLRIEDVDRDRARPEIADHQRSDLAWLGLSWDEEGPAQADRDYVPWLDRLAARTYRCTCTRKALKAVGGRCACATQDHPDGSVRFRLEPGLRTIDDRARGPARVDPSTLFPDPVLRRRDGVFAYTLAVVADDLADGVTEVVRGGDLLDFAAVQEQVWEAFGATPPTWLHTPLVLGPDGRKLSKSHGSTELRTLREAGWDASAVLGTVLPWLGLPPTLDEALDAWPGALAAQDPRIVVDERLSGSGR